MATLPSPPSDLPPMDLFLGHQKLIEEVIAHCCRRSHFKREEAEDFGSLVKIKFLEDDCAILREYQGKSSIRTYLTVVIKRLLMDYQDHLWGKWRYSAEAERLGPVAMRLERLLQREDVPLDEASGPAHEREDRDVRGGAPGPRGQVAAQVQPYFLWGGAAGVRAFPGARPDEQVDEKERARIASGSI